MRRQDGTIGKGIFLSLPFLSFELEIDFPVLSQHKPCLKGLAILFLQPDLTLCPALCKELGDIVFSEPSSADDAVEEESAALLILTEAGFLGAYEPASTPGTDGLEAVAGTLLDSGPVDVGSQDLTGAFLRVFA